MKFLPGKRALVFLAVAAMMLLPLAANAQSAQSFDFARITSNCPTDVASQFYMDVTANSDVLFKIGNSGPIDSVITQIYFYDGNFLDGPATITYSTTGIAFDTPAIPGDLPGYSGPPSTLAYSAGADNPAPQWGVNPGEWVQFEFTLLSGVTFTDLINALGSGDMVVGLHVQSIGESSCSDSFINTPGGGTAPIPVPPTVWLMGSGLVGLGLMRWRRRQ